MQAVFVTQPGSTQNMPYDEAMHPGGRPSKNPRSPLGERIAQTRIQAGLSQTEVAKLMGVTQQVMAAWERKAKSIRTDTLTKLAIALKTTPDALMGIKPSRSRRAVPKGRLQQVFETASQLPRRQQEKIIDIFETVLVGQQTKTNGH
jgi:transcriptional regulator with XRE-family HTH domain